MSLEDWKWDHGWRGITYELARLAWTLVRLVAAVAMMGLVLWAGVSWVAETFAP